MTAALAALVWQLPMIAQVSGTVTDAASREALPGVAVVQQGTTNGAVTDLDGHFELPTVAPGTTLLFSYMGYVSQSLPAAAGMAVALREETREVEGVTVVAAQRQGSDQALLTSMRAGLTVQSGVSADQIRRSQDKDGAEVVRRIAGVSVIGDKFVVVRGLSQRYNNVWINGGAVPSSEADSRAFAFDVIPAGQIASMTIVKSPAAEFPADFTGGFIIVRTTEMPLRNAVALTVGGGVNTRTHWHRFLSAPHSPTDWLGYDNGRRMPANGLKGSLATYSDGQSISLTDNGFDNDWRLRERHPAADPKLSFELARLWQPRDVKVALMASVNYSMSFRKVAPMVNALYGAYDVANDRSSYLRKSLDEQYNRNTRLGALLSAATSWGSGAQRVELRAMYNQLGKSRVTLREGVNAQNDSERQGEELFEGRTTVNVQLGGTHKVGEGGGTIKWTGSYAYANRLVPDRRRWLLSDRYELGRIGLCTGNDVSREYIRLDEHVVAASADYDKTFGEGAVRPTLKVGFHGERRWRDYYTRSFIASWNHTNNALPAGFQYEDFTEAVWRSERFGEQGLYLLEQLKWRNNYEGLERLAAAYAAVSVPVGPVELYAGLRFEADEMTLTGHTRDYEPSPSDKLYPAHDFFPSASVTWHIAEPHILRLTYGRSVNRPEFRERSGSVFYDFDLASDVMGNSDLRPCHVQNFDVRYEWYPAPGELLSLSLFAKRFSAPIEWTYTVQGGTDLAYSYVNAEGATNLGLEVEVRKGLEFLGARGLTLTANVALVKSKVEFAEGSRFEGRPMQGQSPYTINLGLYWQSPSQRWMLSAMYNRIGRRIMGVGRSVGTSGPDQSVNIPHSYEMPRDGVDVGMKWKALPWLTLSAAGRDITGQLVRFEQQVKALHADGTKSPVREVTKRYRPGANIEVSLRFDFGNINKSTND